ncbi:unnamed protein product [Rhodiola kirilowii]
MLPCEEEREGELTEMSKHLFLHQEVSGLYVNICSSDTFESGSMTPEKHPTEATLFALNYFSF